jgi:hypothetical protein
VEPNPERHEIRMELAETRRQAYKAWAQWKLTGIKTDLNMWRRRERHLSAMLEEEAPFIDKSGMPFWPRGSTRGYRHSGRYKRHRKRWDGERLRWITPTVLAGAK